MERTDADRYAVRKHERLANEEPPRRRQRVPGCAYCKTITEKGSPPHDASPRCKSGGNAHCTCDICF